MLQPGQIVTGVVTRREPFGVFVDVAESEPGALLVDAITDGDPSTTMADLPEVGDHVEAVFLGYGLPHGTQPRLSVRRATLGAPELIIDRP
jgi:predicted RNA-binding protein with RPS1 domain